MVAKFDRFFCFGLRQGIAFIGILHGILTFAGMLLLSQIAIDANNSADDLTELYVVSTVGAVVCAIHFICAVLLIIAAKYEHPGFLLPWLIYYPITVVLYVLWLLVHLVSASNDSAVHYTVGYRFVGAGVGCFIAVYKMMFVYSYYKQLKSLNF